MPIFVKKFAPKLSAPRGDRLNIVPKIDEDVENFRDVKIAIDDVREVKFEGPEWVLTTNGNKDALLTDEVALKRKASILEQENNMLNAKIDILLDLLTENVSELNAIKKKVE